MSNFSFLFAAGLLAEGDPLGGMLPLILMIGVVYFIILRPMSKQEKERKKRVEALKKGDEIVLGGGILGRISNADDPKIAVVEIADKVKIRVLKKDIVDTQGVALADTGKRDEAKPASPPASTSGGASAKDQAEKGA
jgi:preprotein translocase subunit YajC